MAETEKSGGQPQSSRRHLPKALLFPIALSVVAVLLIILNLGKIESALRGELKAPPAEAKYTAPKEGSWRFIVSGDSRNCGDVVMPAIAAHSAKYFHPSFYWHLGDLRAIYVVDEDMAFANHESDGKKLACKEYIPEAWADFIQHQIHPFGTTPFYLGIGNHEVIPPKGFPAGSPQTLQPEVNEEQFTSEFSDWLLAPALKQQRLADRDCDSPPESAANSSRPAANKRRKGAPAAPCLIFPRNYFHWIQGGVDFIYLDNASKIFGPAQLRWFSERLAQAANSSMVQSIVVGMHEALPDSISSDHAMCDDRDKGKPVYDQSCREGHEAYGELLHLQNEHPEKNIYVLASHSHFYMDGIFKKKPVTERLHGWIVGTAGAVRYRLPADSNLSNARETDVYGYLVGVVDEKGNIQFQFERVEENDVPPEASGRYDRDFVHWCFAHNSANLDPKALPQTSGCTP